MEIEAKRLAAAEAGIEARLRVQQASVDQAQAISGLRDERLARLKVRPGFAGVLQQVPVEVGQRVAPGQNLARVADPGRLKAELRIPETQAKDVEVGQLGGDRHAQRRRGGHASAARIRRRRTEP